MLGTVITLKFLIWPLTLRATGGHNVAGYKLNLVVTYGTNKLCCYI